MNRLPFFRPITAIAAGLCLASCNPAGESDRYTITGDVSAAVSSGEFVVWVAAPKKDSGGATGMPSVAPASAADEFDTRIRESLNIVAEAPIVDGRFLLKGTVEAPRTVYFHVLNAVNPQGGGMAPLIGEAFILEPGNLRFTMSGVGARFVVDGGRYNDIVVNSWKKSPEYRRLMEDYDRRVRPVDGEAEDQRRARLDGAREIYGAMLGLENEGRKAVAMNHEDPVARKLTLESTWLRDRWFGDAVAALAEFLPDDPWVRDTLAAEEQLAAARSRAATLAVGDDMRDFEAETLDGRTVSISGARKDREVVLVEFWASWCGPCRVEIPHMKRAYANYGPRGFEILSFTVDAERADWEQASEEEQLPWINAGMGPEHPATEACGVTGVPANFLVDASTGKIIARDLRGPGLDEALAERFGNAVDEG